jgi:hypothetical protein
LLGLRIKLAAVDASLLKITQVLGECWRLPGCLFSFCCI